MPLMRRLDVVRRLKAMSESRKADLLDVVIFACFGDHDERQREYVDLDRVPARDELRQLTHWLRAELHEDLTG